MPSAWSVLADRAKPETMFEPQLDWNNWLVDIEAKLHDMFVPKYTQGGRQPADEARIDDLNRTDFEVLMSMQKDLLALPVLIGEHSPSCGFSTVRNLFDIEDVRGTAYVVDRQESGKYGASRALIASTSDPQVVVPLGLPAAYVAFNPASSFRWTEWPAKISPTSSANNLFQKLDGAYDKVELRASSLDFVLKETFQRPRPFQVVGDQSIRRLDLWPAARAITPSFPSGHALQSLVGIVALLLDDYFARLSPIKNGDESSLFTDWAAGVSDRRILGGLHFPSDNLASWYVAGRLFEHVFSSQELPDAKKLGAVIIGKTACWRHSINVTEFGTITKTISALFL